MFKVGDEIVCKRNGGTNEFTKGKIYKIISISDEFWPGGLQMLDDQGQKNGWNPEFFELKKAIDYKQDFDKLLNEE